MNKKEFIVEKSQKLAQIIQNFGLTYADACKIIKNRDAKINGKPVKENVVVQQGEKVTFFFPDAMIEKKFEIIFENDDVFVVYKQQGIESEGEKGLEKVLKNAIAVHRLDRNTEGLMVFVKNEGAAEKFKNAFKNGKVHKFYIAEVVGKLDLKDKVCKAYLSKDSENAIVKITPNAVKGSVEIRTKFNTLKSGKESSLIEIELLTGKTHQIRAHLAFLGHPIIGDGKYGKNSDNKKFQQYKQKLACFQLKFENIGIDGLNNKSFKKLPKWFYIE